MPTIASRPRLETTAHTTRVPNLVSDIAPLRQILPTTVFRLSFDLLFLILLQFLVKPLLSPHLNYSTSGWHFLSFRLYVALTRCKSGWFPVLWFSCSRPEQLDVFRFFLSLVLDSFYIFWSHPILTTHLPQILTTPGPLNQIYFPYLLESMLSL